MWFDDGEMKCECYVFNLVIIRWYESLFVSLWWWFEIRCIYLNNWMRIHVNMVLLKMNMWIWCCDPNIVHAFIFHLCWTYISPSSGCWSPRSLWCRLAGWGSIVDVSTPRTALEPTQFLPLWFCSLVWWCSN